MEILRRTTPAYILALLLAPVAASAAPPELPTDATLKRESEKQLKHSATAIDLAEKQAALLRQSVPNPDMRAALPAPDPAAVAKRYEAIGRRDDDSLFVLVSFSIPPASLERLVNQSSKAGAMIVLRGVVDGSLTKTAELAAQLIKKNPAAQFQIDPGLFKRFGVSQVPTVVLARDAGDSRTCGKECDPINTFSSVSGDVSLDYALEYISRQGDANFAQLAAGRLKRLRGDL
jgi:conjugal transfer pilus assembly protein TrbC